MGFRLDILATIINELNKDTELVAIFRNNVHANLAIYFDGKQISIVERGIKKLDDIQKITSLKRLKAINESVGQKYSAGEDKK